MDKTDEGDRSQFKIKPVSVTVLNVRTTAEQKFGAVPRRVRIQGASIVASSSVRLAEVNPVSVTFGAVLNLTTSRNVIFFR